MTTVIYGPANVPSNVPSSGLTPTILKSGQISEENKEKFINLVREDFSRAKIFVEKNI